MPSFGCSVLPCSCSSCDGFDMLLDLALVNTGIDGKIHKTKIARCRFQIDIFPAAPRYVELAELRKRPV